MKSSRNLPDRRPAESFELEVEGIRYTATLGRFPDGSFDLICREGER